MDQIKLLAPYHTIASKRIKPHPDPSDSKAHAHSVTQGVTTSWHTQKVPQNSAPQILMCITIYPGILLLSIYPREMKTYTHTKT